MRVAFQNINGLSGKDTPVLNYKKQKKIDILLLLETWLSPNQSIIHNPIVHLTSPGDSLTTGGRRFTGGILGIASPAIRPDITTVFEDPTRHYVILKCRGYLLAACYLPPSSPDSTMTQFLDHVTEVAGELPCYIFGDFNARSISLSGDHRNNPRGVLLASYLLDSPIEICSPTRGKYTSFNQHGTGIPDLILALNTGPPTRYIVHEQDCVGSDHCVISFDIPTDRSEPTRSFSRWNVRRMADPETQLLYTRHLEASQAETVAAISAAPSPDEQWEVFKDWLSDAAEFSCGYFRYSSSSNSAFWTEELLAQQQQIRDATAAFQAIARLRQASPFRTAAHAALTQLNRAFRESLSVRKTQVFEDMARNLGNPQNSASLMRLIKTKQSRNNRKHCQLDPDHMETHAAHFRGTFGLPPTGEPVPDISRADYFPRTIDPVATYEQLKRTCLGKAAGPDGFTGEFLYYGAETIAPVLTILLNNISFHCCIPSEWCQALVVPVFKNKGEGTEAKNYRPISLTVIARRLYERMVAEELEPAIQLLSDTQGGFRRGRSTLDQCFVLTEVINHHPEAHHAFLDIKAAFDSVNRSRLWSSLLMDYQVPFSTVSRLRSLFDYNSSTLLIHNRHSAPIPNLRGMFQGSSLSPILFNFFIDTLLKRLRLPDAPSLRTGGIVTNHLGFADDLAIHAGTPAQLQYLLRICQDWSIQNGIEFQPLKCIYLANSASPNSRFLIYDQHIPQANSIDYLGLPFTTSGIDFPTNATRRAQKAKQVVNALNAVGMNIAGFPPAASARLYKSFIRPVFEYGSQLTLSTAKVLQKAQNYALRKIFSAHTSTSTNALQKLLHMEPFLLRNEIISAQFYARLHNSTDLSIPAVRFYRSAVEARRPVSLATELHNKNRVWPKANRLLFLNNRLRRAQSKPAPAFTQSQKKKFIRDAVSSLDAGNSNVAGSITVLPSDPPIRHIFQAATMPPKSIRIPIYRWLLGHIAVHMPCRCGHSDLSRSHAVSCSGITASLSADFPYVQVPEGQTILDAVLNHHRNTCPPHAADTTAEETFAAFYRKIAAAIGQIYTRCLGYRQKDNGFYAAPEPPFHRPSPSPSPEPSAPVPVHSEAVPLPTANRHPVVVPQFVRPPRNPR
jgi:hypothetical protein